MIALNSNGKVQLWASSWANSNLNTPSGFFTLSALFDSASSQLSLNGTTVGSLNTGNFSLSNGIYLGTNYQANADFLGGELAEFIIIDATLSSSEQQSIEGYLAHKWGLTGNLPATHPYKSSKPMFSPYDNAYELHMGTPVSLQVEATKGPDTYSTDSTLAEYGLSIDSNTGVISGTPSKMGDFNCTITVMNSSGSDTKSFFFRVLKGTKSINWDQNLIGLTYGDVPVELGLFKDLLLFLRGKDDDLLLREEDNGARKLHREQVPVKRGGT